MPRTVAERAYQLYVPATTFRNQAPMQPPTDQPQPDAIAARNRRSLAIALALIAFVVIVFTVTLVRLQGAVLNRPF